MIFNSITFIVFFAAFLALWSLPFGWTTRRVMLLIASYIFYASWSPPFVALLWLSTFVDFYAARWIASEERASRRRFALIISLTANLGLLGFFKYGGFLEANFESLAAMVGVAYHAPKWNIVLPLGISFYTFQTLSYTLDVYQRRIAPSRSFLNFALFVTFFPHLVAGPIMRPRDLLSQFSTPKRASRPMMLWGLALITLGLFEKIVLADAFLSGPADKVFKSTEALLPLDAWTGVLAFAGQIFFDFSGYTTTAIGAALVLGFSLPQNFKSPYAAVGFSDFWRRWHISLSTWLRDYLYISLGGNRKGRIRTYLNLMITMLLGGLWHGAAWTFVAWGALHGGVLVFERLWKKFKPEAWPRLPAVLGILITFHIVCLSWILFRAESFSLALDFLAGFGRMGPATVATPFFVSLIVIGLGMHFLPPRAGEAFAGMGKYLPSPALGAAAAALMLVIEAVRPEGIAPFIYFQF